MVEKAKNMTIAEMVEQYDFIKAVLNIPERKNIEPRVDFCPVDYGPGVHQKGVDWCDGGYGYLYAELCRDHAERKAKVRNRRKNNRKYKMTPKMRKEQEWMRNWNICGKYMNCGWTLVNDAKDAESEQFARSDWEIEQDNIADAMQEYADYCLMAEQHEERLEYLRNLTGNVEFWEIMIDEISREKIYEENRIREMRNIANTIMKGECY